VSWQTASAERWPEPALRHHPRKGGRLGGGDRRRYIGFVTPRERLHRLGDELSEAEVEAALTRLLREREAVEEWAAKEDTEATEDAWARANARESIREEPW
jgi:hypothetical protein